MCMYIFILNKNSSFIIFLIVFYPQDSGMFRARFLSDLLFRILHLFKHASWSRAICFIMRKRLWTREKPTNKFISTLLPDSNLLEDFHLGEILASWHEMEWRQKKTLFRFIKRNKIFLACILHFYLSVFYS